MSDTPLLALSNELARLTESRAGSVVQVSGARRPASGVVHGSTTIVTTARAIGREDGLRVRLPDNTVVEADLAGWDPASGIALLTTRTPMPLPPPPLADDAVRAGGIALALGRSWSNAVTASFGIVAIVGGPLRTGRRRQIERVFRVTAPLHDGFAGGGVFDASGALLGIATSTQIRGYGVVIPAAIAWDAASRLLASGTPRRGFIGVAVQPVTLQPSQRPEGRERALLVVAVTEPGPAAEAGITIGDVILDAGGKATDSPEELLEALSGPAVGQTLVLNTLRGGAPRQASVVVSERRQ